MPLELQRHAERRLDLSTFTGDAWALQASLDVPDADVPRLVADGQGPIRWTVQGMSSGKDDATQVADAVTDIDTTIVTIKKTKRGAAIVSALAATTGTVVGLGITEDDVADREVFVVAIPTVTVAGTAPWLWIVPTSGCLVLAEGVSP